jgi:hypothetical protein
VTARVAITTRLAEDGGKDANAAGGADITKTKPTGTKDDEEDKRGG